MAGDKFPVYTGGAERLMLVYGTDEFVARWVGDHIPHSFNGFDPCIAIGYANTAGKLIAGFVFSGYQKECGIIGLTVAAISPQWARRELIHEILSYPFEQLGCYKVFTATPADNEKALKVNNHIGFKREAILAHQFGKKRHAVIMRLLLPDYLRLFGERHVKEHPDTPCPSYSQPAEICFGTG